VHKLRHWQLDSPLPSNKTVKILLKYCLPIPSKRKLPKGWVYVDKEVQDPNLYNNLDQSSPIAQSMLTSALPTYTLPAKLGCKFEENIGRQYVPFCITRLIGEDNPVCFIKVHMTDNLYVEVCMSPFMVVYCGEIHAAAEVDQEEDTEELSFVILKMLEDNYQDAQHIDAALDRVGDLSLEAEVCWWRGLKKCIKGVNKQIQLLEDRMYSLGVNRQLCQQCLQKARAINWVLNEMGRDQHIHPLTPWSVEHRHSS
jgi:hypothetical protein